MERKNITIELNGIPAHIFDMTSEVGIVQAKQTFGVDIKIEDAVTINFEELDTIIDPSRTLGSKVFSEIFSAMLMYITGKAIFNKLKSEDNGSENSEPATTNAANN